MASRISTTVLLVFIFVLGQVNCGRRGYGGRGYYGYRRDSGGDDDDDPPPPPPPDDDYPPPPPAPPPAYDDDYGDGCGCNCDRNNNNDPCWNNCDDDACGLLLANLGLGGTLGNVGNTLDNTLGGLGRRKRGLSTSDLSLDDMVAVANVLT